MDGGSLEDYYIGICKSTVLLMYALITQFSEDSSYLLKCVQGFASKGITPYAISIQVSPLPESLESFE